MYKIDFTKPVKVHFIGIGGISMSGLAELLLSEGFKVSGSDRAPSELTEKLIEFGAEIFYGQRGDNIGEDVDIVVYTAAIRPDNPEYARAVELGKPMLTRAQLLGQVMCNYKKAVAISGTHGKTTTTSMITGILLNEGCDPTVSVGGMLDIIGGNFKIGSSDIFVTEACEYTNSFLDFYPTVGIILNIEEDHLDFFKDIDDIRNSFSKFAGLIPSDGLLVINADIDNYEEITKDLKCKVVTVSCHKDADYTAEDISYNELGNPEFTAVLPDGRKIRIKLSVPGEHNIGNALAAIAAAYSMNVSDSAVMNGLADFKGTDRRFQKLGEVGGVTVIDDYAHHPTEIKATLEAAKRYPHKKLYLVFQPHTYSRTKSLFDDFANALAKADTVILADIYAARETDNLGVSSALLAKSINELGTEALYFSTFDEIENYLLQNCSTGDLLITMGAGDIVKVGKSILGQ